jgi:proteasome lid subunit RPN8/RPN11
MRVLTIGQSHLEVILSHAREGSPNEVCGLMGGKDDTVQRIYLSANVNASPVTYHLDPASQMKAMREMEREGLELVGIYHSHPVSAPVPSQTDVARAFFPGTKDENFPGAIYLIIGLAGDAPDIRAYTISKNGVEEVSIETK